MLVEIEGLAEGPRLNGKVLLVKLDYLDLLGRFVRRFKLAIS